ncbi:hypothetical protein STEG23_033071 [Scotinomys teguina]
MPEACCRYTLAERQNERTLNYEGTDSNLFNLDQVQFGSEEKEYKFDFKLGWEGCGEDLGEVGKDNTRRLIAYPTTPPALLITRRIDLLCDWVMSIFDVESFFVLYVYCFGYYLVGGLSFLVQSIRHSGFIHVLLKGLYHLKIGFKSSGLSGLWFW